MANFVHRDFVEGFPDLETYLIGKPITTLDGKTIIPVHQS